MEPISEPLNLTDFRSHSDYQSQTPESFSSGPPILLHRALDATLRIFHSDLDRAPLLAPFILASTHTLESVAVPEPKEVEEDEENKEHEVSGVDVWVASDYVYLHFPSSSQRGGVRIPYPLITLHAIQPSSPPSIYLQLQSTGRHDDHDPESTLELTIIPAPLPQPTATSPSPPPEPSVSPTQALYAALRDGADFWPDPEDDDEEERPAIMFDVDGSGEGVGDGALGGLPPPMPESGGWITSENVGEFFDENGNWRGGEAGARPDGVNGLGEGAGIIRPRDDDDDDDRETQGINGDETKWRRTD